MDYPINYQFYDDPEAAEKYASENHLMTYGEFLAKRRERELMEHNGRDPYMLRDLIAQFGGSL